MTIQLSTALRNARVEVLDTLFPAVFLLEFRSGTQPATCALASTGTQLWAANVGGANWLAAASGGSASYNYATLGAITGTCLATGTIGYFRMSYAGSCFMQGSCGTSATDFVFSSVDVIINQVINVTSLSFTEGGA